jgi:predicted CoA-binding protein
MFWRNHVRVNPFAMTNAIEQAEREIQRDKDDLKRLKKRYPGYDFIPVDPKKSESPTQRQPRTDFSELEMAVLAVVAIGVDKEWTSRSVVESLRSQGYRLPEKEEAAMNAVGYALIELKDAEKILRSHEGKGRDPHRYCALPIEKEAAPEEKAS